MVSNGYKTYEFFNVIWKSIYRKRQFVEKVTFEPLMDLKQNHNGSWKYYKSCYFLRLCIKPGIQERGTESGERGEWGECYIPGNVAKHSREYC